MSRGIDNNNPMVLNQSTPDPWEGLTGSDPDGLLKFESDVYGMRAGMINLYNVYYLAQYNVIDLANTYFPEDPSYAVEFANEIVRHLPLSDVDQKIPKEKWKDVPCVIAYFASQWECDLDKLNQAVDLLPTEEMKDLFRNAKKYTPSGEAKKTTNSKRSFYERYKYYFLGLLFIIIIALIIILLKKK